MRCSGSPLKFKSHEVVDINNNCSICDTPIKAKTSGGYVYLYCNKCDICYATANTAVVVAISLKEK